MIHFPVNNNTLQYINVQHNFNFNPRLTKPFFVTRLTRGVVTTPSLDFSNWTPYEVDFGINR